MDPPPCVQNAMMTKDKKPFTYTPGGIDLSQIRSPRMARRIERNANYEGVTDVPKTTPHPQNAGPLPPSALAAMQPQIQVQVFPTGPPPPPGGRGGAPPPPPPPLANIPPPPPLQPLPTQKVTTADNQVLERPDMTKIIPDNPMALLRKTGGPQPRKTFVDEMYNQQGPAQRSPPVIQQRAPAPVAQRTPEYVQEQPRYQPPVIEHQVQTPPVQRPPQSPPFHQQVQQRSPEYAQHQPTYQPPIIERVPSAPNAPRPAPEQQVKSSTGQLGSLYIPPINQQTQQQRVVSPPAPPETRQESVQVQSPGTPTLKEAPKPWQAKQRQQEELPPWAKKDDVLPSVRQEVESQVQPTLVQQQAGYQQQTKSPPTQQPSRSFPVHIEIHTNMRPASPHVQQQPGKPQYDRQNSQQQQSAPNAVFVTQPLILQHPGPRGPPNNNYQQPPPQQQRQHQQNVQPRVDNQGARIIPITIERGETSPVVKTPATPGTSTPDRALNRQQSWSNNPTQSNSFKVIQKITHTDDDNEENVPITSHSPKYPQNMPADQVRRMKLSEGDQDLMNRFKQVPRGPQTSNRGPHVRTIPVQIEGDEPPQRYVHPSEQIVPEPKKYTGSSIPSRSFKILQAMTAPDGCANANQVNENLEQYDASPYDHWGYNPNYPPFPPPYWHEYYYNYYYPNSQQDLSKSEEKQTETKALRQTPVSFWGYYPPPYPISRPLKTPSTDYESDTETVKMNPRNTPLSFWGYPYPMPYDNEGSVQEKQTTNEGDVIAQSYMNYQPYLDPYYYHYYYAHPPVYSPSPFYGLSDSDDVAGYSSTDEMAIYSKGFTELPQNTLRRDCQKPKIALTPTLNVKNLSNKDVAEETETETEKELTNSEYSDSDTEVEEENMKLNDKNGLQAIRSVRDIHVYDNDNDSQCTDEEPYIEECSEETTEETEDPSIYIVEDDILPHQLSVIYEESERTDSRSHRESSVMSDATTLAEKTDDEEDDENITHTVNVKLPLKISRNDDALATVTVCETEVNYQQIESEVYTSFTIKSPRSTSKNRSPGRFETELPTIRRTEDDANVVESIVTNASNLEMKQDNPNINELLHSEIGKLNVRTEGSNEKTKSSEETVKDLETNEPQDESDEDWWSILNKEEDTYTRKPNVARVITPPWEPKDILESTQAEEIRHSEEKDPYSETETLHISEHSIPSKVNNGANFWESVEGQSEDLEAENISDKDAVYNEVSKNSGEALEDDDVADTSSTCSSNSSLSESNVPKYTASDQTRKTVCDTEATKTSVQNCNILDKQTPLRNVNSLHINSTNTKAEPENPPDLGKTINEISVSSIQQEEVTTEEIDFSVSDSESSDSSEESCNDVVNVNNENGESFQPLSIKDRIKALKESIKEKEQKLKQKYKIKTSVKDKVTAIEISGVPNRSKTTSTKSSLKSFEDLSEEEGDSGVTSDMSRHISDTEEFPELKKMSRYQRAATHSRLFKLLQEGCEESDEEIDTRKLEDTISSLTTRQGDDKEKSPAKRRDQLSLPLKNVNAPESFSSSGMTSPASPIHEKLANELVLSLLKRKKGHIFRGLPKDKIFAAAMKVLHENLDGTETPSEGCAEFLSPLRTSDCSTAAQTPQEFYSSPEYMQYYDSWNEYNENYDILPSKAFRLIQEHTGLNKTGAIAGLLAKCPRILSSKNVHKELLKLLESSECPSPPSEKSLEPNDVTSAS